MDSTKMVSHRKLVDTVKDKQFKGPLNVLPRDVIIEPVLKSSRPVFSLDKADYQTLTKTASSVPTFLIVSCFGVFVAYTLELVAKIWEALRNETKLDFEPWKVWVLTVSLVLSFLGSFIIRHLPTEKNKLLKTIQNCVNGRQKIIEARRKNSNRTGDTDAIE